MCARIPIKVAPKKTNEFGMNKSTSSIIAKLMGTDKEKGKKAGVDKMKVKRTRRKRSPVKKKENPEKA
jgi:hypothetical protein